MLVMLAEIEALRSQALDLHQEVWLWPTRAGRDPQQLVADAMHLDDRADKLELQMLGETIREGVPCR